MKFPPFLVPLLAPLVTFADAPETKMDLSEARRILQAAVEDRAFPGCAAAVGTEKGIVWAEGFGRTAYEDGESVTTETLYDLASLTKVVGTTGALMRLHVEGKLDVGKTVGDYLPAFMEKAPSGEDKALREGVQVRHLMTHTSGWPAWRSFWKEVDTYPDLIDRVLSTPFEAAPGERYTYSDLGFITLGEMAGQIGGKPLPELERELLFEPLGMCDTRRNPPMDLLPRIAVTEYSVEIDGFLHGVVHDENSRHGEGLTGHAGLFSTVGDLSRYSRELLLGLEGKSLLFPKETVELFTALRTEAGSARRTLGWSLASGRNSAGREFSESSFGHTGYTGTSMWIDPERKIFAILLGNRVHPTRENSRHIAVRRNFADAVAKAYDAAASAGEAE